MTARSSASQSASLGNQAYHQPQCSQETLGHQARLPWSRSCYEDSGNCVTQI